MRPYGIPLAWQLWPSVGSCTPLAPETIAHSYLQEPAHKLILKTVVPTVSSPKGYCYTCPSNFLTRISLVYWTVARGKSALSSSDVCVSRIESIKCLFGKDVVVKHGPSTPVMHGALYFRICGREHIYVLCRRTMRRRPYVRLLSRSWSWSPTGGGVVSRISGYSPDTPLPAKMYKGHCYTSNDNKIT